MNAKRGVVVAVDPCDDCGLVHSPTEPCPPQKALIDTGDDDPFEAEYEPPDPKTFALF